MSSKQGENYLWRKNDRGLFYSCEQIKLFLYLHSNSVRRFVIKIWVCFSLKFFDWSSASEDVCCGGADDWILIILCTRFWLSANILAWQCIQNKDVSVIHEKHGHNIYETCRTMSTQWFCILYCHLVNSCKLCLSNLPWSFVNWLKLANLQNLQIPPAWRWSKILCKALYKIRRNINNNNNKTRQGMPV